MGKAISSHVVSSTSGYGPNRSVALAKPLQVSDVWLVKTCRLSDIPLPPRGYWAKFGCLKERTFSYACDVKSRQLLSRPARNSETRWSSTIAYRASAEVFGYDKHCLRMCFFKTNTTWSWFVATNNLMRDVPIKY
jgi:hypothetical protein